MVHARSQVIREELVNEPYVERLIREATERGELTPTVGVGKPIQGLDRDDPDWWVRSWLHRDRATRASEELTREMIRSIALALRSDDQTALHILAELNQQISEHNRGRAAEDQMPLVDVDAIIARRARIPRSSTETRDRGGREA